MDNTNDESDLMLNEIRKELMAIIEGNGNPSQSKLPIGTNVKQVQVPAKDDGGDKAIQKDEMATGTTRATSSATSIIDLPGSHTIDEDLENMRFHLNQSYELFQSIGDRFENLNFNGLLNRIRDLNLSDNKTNAPLNKIVNDLKGDFEDTFINNRLHELTKNVKTKFNNHSGEFGDIPELCEFFRACTQLENGLERLRKQRNEISNLNIRIQKATGNTYKRVDVIQKTLNEQNVRGAAGDIGDRL